MEETLCPNCGKPLLYRAVRCLECGHSLRLALLEFDLEPDPPAASPTWTRSALADRWLGASAPFLLSLLWLGGVALASPESLSVLSLLAAPFLRFLLPLTLSRSLAKRLPWLAAGLKNALWSGVAFALALGFVLLFAVPLWLIGGFLTGCGDFNSTPRSFDNGVRLTPALLASTLVAQGLLAGFLPPAAALTARGVRLPARARTLETVLGTALVLCLALRWVLPAEWKDIQSVVAGVAGLLLTVLGVRRALKSEYLTPFSRALVIGIALVLGALTFWTVR